MKIKDFKEIISNIPVEFDEYEVIYSDIEEGDDDSYVRIDDLLMGMVSDDEGKKMCFMGESSYKTALALYTDTEDDENKQNE